MEHDIQFGLEEKTVFITGGAGFLGEYFVKALVGAGAKVIVGEHPDSLERAEQLVSAVEGAGSVQAVAVDVRSSEDVDRVMSDLFSSNEIVDAVINNAAVDPKFEATSDTNTHTFEHYPEEAMRESVDVNMLGYWRVAKAAVARMLKQGSGHIINISSIYGVTVPHQELYPDGTQKPVDYGMTKSAIQYMTRYIAGTYGKQGIRSNALVFGGVLRGHSEDFQREYGRYSMLGRMTDPDEIGPPLVFLVSDGAKGMTGHLLAVDAGWSAW